MLTGNLTTDPELRSLPSGTSVCNLRLACNTRRKNGATGEWEDKPNYFNVTVWGAQGENCGALPLQGTAGGDRRPARVARVGGPGRAKRQAVDIIADSVQFLGWREDSGGRTFADRSAGDGPPGAATSPSTKGTSSPPGVRRSRDDDIPF